MRLGVGYRSSFILDLFLVDDLGGGGGVGDMLKLEKANAKSEIVASSSKADTEKVFIACRICIIAIYVLFRCLGTNSS